MIDGNIAYYRITAKLAGVDTRSDILGRSALRWTDMKRRLFWKK
jgi:hypothetical protein